MSLQIGTRNEKVKDRCKKQLCANHFDKCFPSFSICKYTQKICTAMTQIHRKKRWHINIHWYICRTSLDSRHFAFVKLSIWDFSGLVLGELKLTRVACFADWRYVVLFAHGCPQFFFPGRKVFFDAFLKRKNVKNEILEKNYVKLQICVQNKI